ncbi:MAG: hypothetical protein F7B17_07605 [Desulfurococcales archaeon]|nr:hypothetical protein [Desulfurococcales archaeon]
MIRVSIGCKEALKVARESPVILFHWDTDGVASAGLASRHLNPGARLRVIEPLGVYGVEVLPGEPRGELILDYGLPGNVYDSLASRGSLAVIDHHRVEPAKRLRSYCNPVAEGLGGEGDYPSCSMLLYKLLERPGGRTDRGLAALGVVGDLAPFIDSRRPHRGVEEATRVLEGTGYTIERLRRLAEAVDSSYRVNNPGCLNEAAKAAAEDGVEGVEALECIWEAREKASRLLEEALSKLQPLDAPPGVIAYALEMDALVTSQVGRLLASRSPGSIVVLAHTIPSQGRGIVYVRSVSKELTWLRRALEEAGVKAGGKDYVVVVNARSELLKSALDAVLKALEISSYNH